VISYKDIALQILSYSSQADYNCYRVIANFVPVSLAWQRGSVGEKCHRQHSMAHPRKPPYRRKNIVKISYASRIIANFVLNFVAMATGVSRGKCNWQHSMVHPRKPPYRCKNLEKSLTQAEL